MASIEKKKEDMEINKIDYNKSTRTKYVTLQGDYLNTFEAF